MLVPLSSVSERSFPSMVSMWRSPSARASDCGAAEAAMTAARMSNAERSVSLLAFM